jgi:hypothetical protein
MYTLNVTTDYYVPLNFATSSQSSSIHKGMPAHFQNLGNFRLHIPGAGEVNLIDLGEKKIAGFSKATWGVLIGYHGEECEFRYEGGGVLNLHVTDLAQVELSSNGSIIQVSLPSFIFKKH